MTFKTGSWKQDLVLQGRAFQVTVGTLSTPITGGGAGTVIDLDQSELRISVPDGTAIIPLRVRVDCQTPLIAADDDEAEILIAVAAGQAIVDGTDTAETPFNMRTDNALASSCTVSSATTVDHTDPVLDLELAHKVVTADVQGTAGNALWGELFEEYAPEAAPALIGPATLIVYFGGTVAVTGFISAEWAEFNDEELTT
jgi:hypothetical protein